MLKTRIAYGTHRESKRLYILGDTVAQSLDANMSVRDWERQLVAKNPQLDITFKVEPLQRRR